MSKQFNQVNLGRVTKMYRHQLRKEVSSTFSFGVTQPFMCRFMNGNESISGRINDMIRLAPMPLPTHGDIYKEILMRFVPAVEVCPYYECIKSKIPYNSGDVEYVPISVPLVDSRILTIILLMSYSFCSKVVKNKISADGEHPQYEVKYEAVAPTTFATLLKDVLQITVSGSPLESLINGLAAKNDFFDVGENVAYLPTLDSADYIFSDSDLNLTYCFRLTQTGRLLRKNLIGLGYSLAFDDNSEVSMLPILAYYKAYFDTYYPKRYVQWTSTKAFQLIKYIEHNFSDCYRFTSVNMGGTELGYELKSKGLKIFYEFITDELAQTYATLPINYISAHREDPMTVDMNMSYIDNERMTISSTDKQVPELMNPITSISLAFLRRISKYANKDSVIGQSLSKWLRIHEGSNVYNTVFSDSNKIGYWRYDFSIDSVYSTSDTATKDSGEVLGAYAGKGIGSMRNGSFKFKAESYGYVIGFASILPEIGYYQGNDPQLYAINADTMYQPEYDAVGFELTPRYCVIGDNGCFVGVSTRGAESFGYIPRYSGLKVEKNIVNGDMSLRSTKDNLSAYHLNCEIVNFSVAPSIPSSAMVPQIGVFDVPNASTEWQYPTKNHYIGNFNRIFYNSGQDPNHDFQFEGSDIYRLEDDNFVSFTTVDYSLSSRMLPISDSYDCFDDELDNGKQTVQNS